MSNEIEPVQVDIVIENPRLVRDAFYNLCFITESDVAPRTLEVKSLTDLLSNGYNREDLAYNFCVGVFAQQEMNTVYIRAKRFGEDYIDAYQADDNSGYYYVIIQSKDIQQIESFGGYLSDSDEMKLLLFSGGHYGDPAINIPTLYRGFEPEIPIGNYFKKDKIVEYLQDRELFSIGGEFSKNFYIDKAYGDTSSEITCYPTGSGWSQPVNFEMLNRPNSFGGVQVEVYFEENLGSGGGLQLSTWVNLANKTTVEEFFIDFNSKQYENYYIETRDIGEGYYEIRVSPIESSLTGTYIPITVYPKTNRADFYTYSPEYTGTNAENTIDLGHLLLDVGSLTYCDFQYIGGE